MKVVLLLSGGIDSAVLLYDLLSQGDTVEAITLHYGQSHWAEATSAAELAKGTATSHSVLYLGSLFARGALIPDSTSNPISSPETPPLEEATYVSRAELTVVPGRNLVFLSIAAAHAYRVNAAAVAYAAHGGDTAVYPDCRLEFANAMSHLFTLNHTTPLQLLAPYLCLPKAELVTRGKKLGAPLEVTWSCDFPQHPGPGRAAPPIHCGKCSACKARQEAFSTAGVADPTTYHDGEPPPRNNFPLKTVE